MLSLRLTLLNMAECRRLPPDAFDALLRLTRSASPRVAVTLHLAAMPSISGH